MEQQTSGGGYGKKSVGKWIFIYIVIAIVVYGIIYIMVISKKGGGYTTTPPAAGTTYEAVTIPAPAPVAPIATRVAIQNFIFSPATLTVKVGDTVTWTNKDSAPHTVTSDSGTMLNSANLATGESFSFTFTQAGTFTYHCAVHPMMKATVIVK